MVLRDALLCPCGEPAPADLPSPGRSPARCARCGTPLVSPGGVPRDDAERGLGAALLVASLLAILWMFAARWTDGAAHWALPVGGAAVGLAAGVGARARGPSVQAAAVTSYAAFVALGEVLLYRGALVARLTALHEAEGVADAEEIARRELESTGVSEFLHLELDVWMFLGLAVGAVLALRLTRGPEAVEAFLSPVGPGVPVAPREASAEEERERADEPSTDGSTAAADEEEESGWR